MESDPDAPGYRYPGYGERLWHRPSGTWVIIEGQPDYGPSADEVDARCESDGKRVTVKLRSLDHASPTFWDRARRAIAEGSDRRPGQVPDVPGGMTPSEAAFYLRERVDRAFIEGTNPRMVEAITLLLREREDHGL